ncbi:MBL fold metallo-hydrolase [Hungatella hathewayi]
MRTQLYPIVQFKKDTWEIDEFDCASIFLLVGEEKAMVIDTGMGIGDLKGAIEKITNKPLVVVITHGHVDHTGNIRQFDEVWMNSKDKIYPIPDSLERRKEDARLIAMRQQGIYAYDPDCDIIEGDKNKKIVFHELHDGMQFDLGGRIITAYECPGHTPGEMVLLDEKTRCLFVGDALNYHLGMKNSGVPIETALRYLERIQNMKDQYDGIYNGHHDYRALGVPLGEDCLPNAIDLCRQLISGNYETVVIPNHFPGRADNVVVKKGKNILTFAKERIHEA